MYTSRWESLSTNIWRAYIASVGGALVTILSLYCLVCLHTYLTHIIFKMAAIISFLKIIHILETAIMYIDFLRVTLHSFFSHKNPRCLPFYPSWFCCSVFLHHIWLYFPLYVSILICFIFTFIDALNIYVIIAMYSCT